VSAALSLAPEQAMPAIAEEVRSFAMPGTEVPGFMRKSLLMAEAGIYDVRLHRDEVVAPLMRHWALAEVHITTDAAQRAQAAIVAHLEKLERIAARYESRRAARNSPAQDSER
jgi:acyl-[acyl-carrier-protein] desaturase